MKPTYRLRFGFYLKSTNSLGLKTQHRVGFLSNLKILNLGDMSNSTKVVVGVLVNKSLVVFWKNYSLKKQVTISFCVDEIFTLVRFL
jgi:hypothetical protein